MYAQSLTFFNYHPLIDKKNPFHSSLNVPSEQQGLAEPHICVCIDTPSVSEATGI